MDAERREISRRDLLRSIASLGLWSIAASCGADALAYEPSEGTERPPATPTATTAPTPTETATPLPIATPTEAPPTATAKPTSTPTPEATSTPEKTGDILKDELPNVAFLGFTEGDKEFLRKVVALTKEHAPEKLLQANELIKFVRKGEMPFNTGVKGGGYNNKSIYLPREYIHLIDNSGREWSGEVRVYFVAVWLFGHELIHAQQQAEGRLQGVGPGCSNPEFRTKVEKEAYAKQVEFARLLAPIVNGTEEGRRFVEVAISEWSAYAEGQVPVPACQ